MRPTQRGNVLFYILIAIALLAALVFTLTRDSGNGEIRHLSNSQTELYATKLIAYAASAKMAVQQMEMSGIPYDEIVADLPGTAGYSTNVTKQLYHPQGGGLEVFVTNDDYWDAADQRGWTFKSSMNFEWTATTGSDPVFTFVDLNPDICIKINEILNKESTQYVLNGATTGIWAFGNAGVTTFNTAWCADCVNKASACVQQNTGASNNTAFYNILGAR